MLKYLPIFLALLIFTIGYSQDLPQYNKRKKLELNGNVKSVRQTLYFAIQDSGKVEKNGIADAHTIGETPKYFEFNQKGDLIKRIHYYSDGSIENKTLFKYDSEGKLVRKSFLNPNYSRQFDYILKYEKNGDKQILKIYQTLYKMGNDSIKENQLEETKNYKYSKNGLLISKSLYDSEGNIEHKNSYTYNDKKRKIKELHLDYEERKGSYKIMDFLSYKTIFEYNEKGNLIEKKELSLKDKLDGRWVYKYNAYGDIIEIRSNKYSITDSHRRDPIYTVEISGHVPKGKLLFTQKYRYDYDEKGNWIKKYELKKDTVQFITERIIRYYDD